MQMGQKYPNEASKFKASEIFIEAAQTVHANAILRILEVRTNTDLIKCTQLMQNIFYTIYFTGWFFYMRALRFQSNQLTFLYL